MKKNFLWIVIVVLCVALFICAYMLYGQLKDDYAPSNLAPVPTEQASSEDAEATQTEATQTEATQTEAPQVQTAPDFSAQDMEGNTVKLSDYFGKPIVLNLWASWCGPCQGEMPHFQAAYLENPDVQFLMVNLTAGDTMQAAQDLINANGYTFPVLYDVTGEASYTYNASSIPMTFFIGADGQIVTYAVGALSADSLAQGIDLIRK